MVDFVLSIAKHARVEKGVPGFLVFPQNGEGLAAQPEYVGAVSGIGKEDLFYMDNDPMPATSTAAAEANLDVFLHAGRPVLAIDYVTTQATIDAFHSHAEARGYIPYATVRDLDVLTVNPGHAPD